MGILSALGGDGVITSRVPGGTGLDAGEPMVVTVRFERGEPRPTPAVVFLAEGYGESPIVDNWCPTVNLFPTAADARTWARGHGVGGHPVPVAELVADATAMWAPVVP